MRGVYGIPAEKTFGAKIIPWLKSVVTEVYAPSIRARLSSFMYMCVFNISCSHSHSTKRGCIMITCLIMNKRPYES